MARRWRRSEPAPFWILKRVEGQRRGVQRERRVTVSRSRRGRHGDKIRAWINVDEVVGQAVAVEIRQRHGSAQRRYPGGNAAQARMNLADVFVRRMAGDFGQRQFVEFEPRGQFHAVAVRDAGKARHRITGGDHGNCSHWRGMAEE